MNKTRKNLIFKMAAVMAVLIYFSSCEDTSYIKHTFTANIPTRYMSYDDLRSAVKVESPRTLKDPGKIYFKANHIFVCEKFKGIHVINNYDPQNPQNIAFINIPGNVDISIKGSILYADSYTDLIAVDISDLNNIVITKRIEDVFDYPLYGYDPEYPIAEVDQEQGVVTGWEVKEVTVKIDPETYNSGTWSSPEFFLGASKDNAFSEGFRFNSNSTGKAGSMARFMIYDKFLYIINNWEVDIFDISEKTNPVNTNNSFVTSRNIETLFVYEDYLFIGSTTGMIVYSLSIPSSPVYVSSFDHATACDPVVVEDDYAYITLRSGNACGGFQDQLDVVNVENVSYPYHVKTYQMEGPYGLGIDDDVLFVCDGNAGLKVYDATDPANLSMIKTFNGIDAYDVIPVNGILLLIGSNGLYQYDYTDPTNIQELGHIPVVR